MESQFTAAAETGELLDGRGTKKEERPGKALVAALVAIILVIGGRWYAYVAYADNPFDEVGIGLNTMMPDLDPRKGLLDVEGALRKQNAAPGRLRRQRQLVNCRGNW